MYPTVGLIKLLPLAMTQLQIVPQPTKYVNDVEKQMCRRVTYTHVSTYRMR